MKKTKRMLSFVLAFALAIGVFGVLSFNGTQTAKAASEVTYAGISFDKVLTAPTKNGEFLGAGNYYLSEDLNFGAFDYAPKDLVSNITINIFLNGHKITYSGNGSVFLCTSVNLSIYANDGVVLGSGGTIESAGDFNAAIAMNSGAFTLNGGTIKSYSVLSSANESKITINSGKLEASSGYAIKAFQPCDIVINGGNIVSTDADTIFFSSAGTLTINGGSISSTANGAKSAIYFNSDISTGNKITINGDANISSNNPNQGTITLKSTNNNMLALDIQGGTVSNGYVNSEIIGYAVYFANAAITADKLANVYSNSGGIVGKVYPVAPVSAGFTVTYNGNGNTGGTVPTDSRLYKANEFAVAASNSGNLVKTGYTFSGWNIKADGTGGDMQVGGSVVMTKNITYYAKWVANSAGEKTEIDVGAFTFNNSTTVYSGNIVTVVATGFDSSMVTVVYANNSLTEVGTKTAAAVFTLADSAIYTFKNGVNQLSATITITKATAVITWAADNKTATSNLGTIVYTYSGSETGEFSAIKPTKVGTYRIKATIIGTHNFSGIEEIKSFIMSANDVKKKSNLTWLWVTLAILFVLIGLYLAAFFFLYKRNKLKGDFWVKFFTPAIKLFKDKKTEAETRKL